MIGQSFLKLSGRIFPQNTGIFLFSTQADLHNVLRTHLGLDDKRVERLVKSHEDYLLRIPTSQIVRNGALFEKLNVEWTTETNIARCLHYVPITLEHRICLLQEMGVQNIIDEHVSRLPASMRLSASVFKKVHKIPAKQKIVDNIMNVIGGPITDISKVQAMSNRKKVFDHYKACMLYYKTWHLKLSQTKLLTYHSIKYQSFRILSKIVDFLDNELKVDRTFLDNNPYLLGISPENATALINDLKDEKIAGRSINEIINKWPRFLFYNVENVKKMLKSLKEYNISDNSIITCLDIFRVDNDVFCERMKKLQEDPDLRVWLQHPRLLYLIIHHKLVKDRVEYLRILNRKRTSNLHTISSVRKFFLRHIQDETSHTAHRKFLHFLLRKELGDGTEYLLGLIARHPNWKAVALTDVQAILLYLKKHYTIEDICQSIHIILYPVSVVQKLLATLYEEYSPQNGYNFTPSQYLALCVYMLERENHFTGDGVWRREFSSGLVHSVKEREQYETFIDTVNTEDNISGIMNTESTESADNVHEQQ